MNSAEVLRHFPGGIKPEPVSKRWRNLAAIGILGTALLGAVGILSVKQTLVLFTVGAGLYIFSKK
ncbi:MAG: hypothetical protein M1142_04580 [Patescibacteria group bacterium]|nr:hypothetical protein [Patescibacteria group bacterium]